MAHHTNIFDFLRYRLAPREYQTLQRLTQRMSSGSNVLSWRPREGSPGEVSSAALAALRPQIQQHEEDQRTAPELLKALEETPADERPALIRSDQRFHTFALCTELVSKSREWSLNNPRHGEELARCALLVAEHLDSDLYGEQRLRGLQARIWSEIANARRLAADLVGSEEMFDRAGTYLDGSTDEIEWARFYDLKASLRRTQRRSDEAIELRDRAIRIYRRYQQLHSMACVMVNKACDLIESSRPEEGAEMVRIALEHLDPTVSHRTIQAARHNWILALLDQGKVEEADRLLPELDAAPYKTDLNAKHRSLWLRAKVATEKKRHREAEVLLSGLREQFAELDLSWEFAMVSLDLAIVYLQGENPGRVKQLVAEILPVFRSMNLYRDGLASIALLEKALAAESLSVQHLREIKSKLQLAQPR